MDIATLLESHKNYIMELAVTSAIAPVTDDEKNALSWLHDRATTKTLLDLYRSGQTGPNGEVKPLGQAALTTPVPTRGVKAGSKAARQRAIKAGETRRRNLAARQNTTGSVDIAEPALSPATHLAPRPPEGGAA